MLTVSLLPLVIFAGVIAADLVSVSHSTVDEANRSILEAQAAIRQRSLGEQAKTLEVKLDAITAQLRALRSRAADLLRPQATPGPTVPAATALPFEEILGLRVVQGHALDGAATTVIAGLDPATGQFDAARATRVAQTTAALVTAMESARTAAPEIRFAWIADATSASVRTVPAVTELATAVGSGVVDANALLGRGGDAPFSALGAQLALSAPPAAAWEGEGVSPQQNDPRAVFTDTYARQRTGDIGVTAWMPVGQGTRFRVGVDIDVRQLVVGLVPAAEKGSSSLLLSSGAQLLGGDGSLTSDFGLGQQWLGSSLSSERGPMADGLAGVLATGTAAPVRSRLGGVDKEVFTATIAPAHWVLVTTAPVAELLPPPQGLSRGIDNGVRRILAQVIPLGLGLCALAFLLSTLIARRLVGPVRALTVAAQRLGDGRTDEPVPPQGRDEVGLMAVSLERMRREVNASRDAILAAARELEGRVAQRTTELRERNEELVALNTLAGSLTRSLDPQTILSDALDTLRAFIPLRAGCGYLLEGGRLTALAPWQESARTNRSTALAEIAASAVRSQELEVGEARSGTLLGLPLATSEGALGALAGLARPGWHMAGRTRTLLRAVADQVALALRTAALSAEGRERAVLEERTRLAREIHDTLAQQLTAIVLQLEAAEAFVPRDRGRARSAVVEAREQARSALQEARRSVWNLRPTSLDATGLVGAITLEARRWEQRTGVATRVRGADLPVDLAVEPQAEVALFRIVQEALNNVAKHSQAAAVEVRVEQRDHSLVLAIADDGAGFLVTDGGDERRDTFGLVGMEERARLIGGTLDVESSPGSGTTVTITVPLSGAPRVAAGA